VSAQPNPLLPLANQSHRLLFRRKSNRRMSVQDFLQKVDSKIEGTTPPLLSQLHVAAHTRTASASVERQLRFAEWLESSAFSGSVTILCEFKAAPWCRHTVESARLTVRVWCRVCRDAAHTQ
jgi:hypothetical protein